MSHPFNLQKYINSDSFGAISLLIIIIIGYPLTFFWFQYNASILPTAFPNFTEQGLSLDTFFGLWMWGLFTSFPLAFAFLIPKLFYPEDDSRDFPATMLGGLITVYLLGYMRATGWEIIFSIVIGFSAAWTVTTIGLELAKRLFKQTSSVAL